MGLLSQDQLEVARILRQNALRLQRLIEDLLNYHTVQFQKSGLQPQAASSCAPVLHRVADAHQLPVRAKEIRLKLDCPSIALEADENKLEVILDNLLSNAVKFSPPFGEVAVAARVRGNEVLIDVADEGPGIAQQEREQGLRSVLPGLGQAARSGQRHGPGAGHRARIRRWRTGARCRSWRDAAAGAHFRVQPSGCASGAEPMRPPRPAR